MTAACIQTYFDHDTGIATHLVSCAATRAAAVIDSVLDYDPKSGRTATTSAQRVLEGLQAHDLQLQWLLETHAHADHLSAAPWLQARAGGRIGIGSRIREAQAVFKGIFHTDDMATDGRPLAKPVLLLPAIQVNVRAGHFPPPESNGTVYLEVPIDRV